MNIPKIIHQTWKDANIPELYKPLIETWQQYHPDWEYRLWTDDMNREFIKENHPDYLAAYDNFPNNIQRVDAVRYFILYNLGGVFIDLDFECIKSIEPLLQTHDCVFGVEPDEHCKRFDKDMIICNAFMATSAKHPFFEAVCADLKANNYTDKNRPRHLEILESTGPFKLTEMYNQYKHKDEINLLPGEVLYPLSLDERLALINGEDTNTEIDARLERAYAVHYFLSSWW